MPAPIVIDVGIAEPQRDLAGALVEACTQAVASAGTDCRLVRDAPSGPYAAIAIVTWEDGDRARVEVGIRREPTSEWRTRELTFQSADAELERYRSVGFVIGSLAIAAHDDAAPGSKPPVEPHSTPAVEPLPPPLATPTPTGKKESGSASESESTPPSMVPKRGWVGIVGTVGGALDHGSARFGAQLDVGVRVVSHLHVLVSGGASARPRDGSGLAPEWLDAGVGLGASLGPPELFHVDAQAQLLVEQFSAHVRAARGNDENSRTTARGRFGVVGVLPLGDVFDVVLGATLAVGPATVIHVGGAPDGATRNAELGAAAGLRLEL